MSHDTSLDRFSTVAEFELLTKGTIYAVAQVAPGFLILDKPNGIPVGPATLIIRTEGEEIRRDVTVLSSAESSTRVEISREQESD
jgi:hypothetical protein